MAPNTDVTPPATAAPEPVRSQAVAIEAMTFGNDYTDRDDWDNAGYMLVDRTPGVERVLAVALDREVLEQHPAWRYSQSSKDEASDDFPPMTPSSANDR